ncbi:hypothetical protein [Calorimonas adulescens]|uniref:hypothetical protein n=1 Tax=Calorimonas adulescens TaxID=2606906 RepID=UPI0013969FD0|nr:hypothetical protein [Calorimonas adulescens]
MIVSIGVNDMITGMSNKRVLNSLRADGERISELTGEFHAESLHLFTFDTYIKMT